MGDLVSMKVSKRSRYWELWDRASANIVGTFSTRREARDVKREYDDPDVTMALVVMEDDKVVEVRRAR